MSDSDTAADLLQQVKDFIWQGDQDHHHATGPSSNQTVQALPVDLASILSRLQASNHSDGTLRDSNNLELDLSEYPYPIRVHSTTMAVLLSAYTLIILSSLPGNFLVLFVILKMRRMHTVTNIFILNVAISDILITSLNIPFNLVRVLMDAWPFGSLMCHVIPFIQVVGVYSSSWTMVCIAVDRLIVTVYPLRPRMRIKTGIILVCLVWTFSILAAIPYAVVHQTTTTVSFTTAIRCIAQYPAPGPVFRRYLSLATFVLQFCIPLSITGVCYGKIANKLWFSQNFFNLSGSGSSNSILQPIHNVAHQNLVIRNRQRSIKMLILVVVVFAVCWLPISLYHLTRDFSADSERHAEHSLFVFLLLHWMAMSSVCYNPYIYCCWNSCYRNQAKLIYRFICCCIAQKGKDGQSKQQVTIRGLIVRFKSNMQITGTSDDAVLGSVIGARNGGKGGFAVGGGGGTGGGLSTKDDYSPGGMKSFNWDSVAMAGTKDLVCFREGRRVYNL
ncbi:putative G-protein coupled receptor 83 [Hypsibius exemplaris]|uniref:G-protein coupled receptor 83 n=1 Tax=Hypsibius exemplaris TaxID=2072580 RepID=A0A1W0XA73_HYPEX|nr:putative G-protein coupled receptor 83 [Hypsibius exemplaris]